MQIQKMGSGMGLLYPFAQVACPLGNDLGVNANFPVAFVLVLVPWRGEV
jgi:hypothetical protein